MPIKKTDETNLAERFWTKVEKHGPDECWPWLGGRDSDDYGLIKINGKHVRATHVAIYLATGSWPAVGECGLHKCDNPPCCNFNAAHVVRGTKGDNNRDRAAKGRSCSGDAHWTRKNPGRLEHGDDHWSRRTPEKLHRGPHAADSHHAKGERNGGGGRLKWTDVVEIRRLHAEGAMTQQAIATKFGVKQQTISSIVRNRMWLVPS